MSEQTCTPCQPVCASVFDRVMVSYLGRGGCRVFWSLLPTFADPGPLVFQLQVGSTNNPEADDWTDIGLSVEDQYFAVDPEQRVWGKLNWTHYRIKLTTSVGIYYSLPTFGLGVLDRRAWRLAKEIIRQRSLAYSWGEGQRGFLLKRRVSGMPCPVCLDKQTQEVRDPNCPQCYGTGYYCGYYYPVSCVWAKLDPRAYRLALDGGVARGTIGDMVVRAEMLAVDFLSENDLWVNAKTDDRYIVHSVQHTAEHRGVPLVANVEMRLAPFTSIVYTIPIPEQDAELE